MTTTVKGRFDTQRAASTEWVRIGDMRVTPSAQRKFIKAHADKIAASFDLEALGYPVVNHRDGAVWIVDGQHRVAALRQIGFGPEQHIECEAYHGLTERQEAELFLERAMVKAITPLDRFRIAITAGRATETEILKIVEYLNLKVGAGQGKIAAVGTLIRLYTDGGPDALGRTLLILRESYGESGFGASIIEGVGLVVRRYGTQLPTDRAVKALQAAAGGASGLDQRANAMRKATGNSKGACVAASVVEIINRSRGKKFPGWWKAEG